MYSLTMQQVRHLNQSSRLVPSGDLRGGISPLLLTQRPVSPMMLRLSWFVAASLQSWPLWFHPFLLSVLFISLIHSSLDLGPTLILQDDFISKSYITSAKTLFSYKMTFIDSRYLMWIFWGAIFNLSQLAVTVKFVFMRAQTVPYFRCEKRLCCQLQMGRWQYV